MKNSSFIKFGLLFSFTSIISAASLNDGTYIIKSMHSGECLEVDTSIENSKLIQSRCIEDKGSQLFNLTKLSNDNYNISNLSVGNKSLDNGVHFFNSATPDEFKLVSGTTSNTYSIKSVRSKKLMTLVPYTNMVIQYYTHGGKEQMWEFIPNEDTTDIPLNALFGKKVVKLVFQPLQSSNNAKDLTSIYDTDGNLLLSKNGWRQQ